MVDPSVSVNPLSYVQHPRITKITRKAIQDFLAQRDSYEVAVASQEGLSPVPYANCFNSIFLRSLVRARVFGKDIKEVSQLTDEIIKEKLSALSSKGRAVSYDEVMADVKRSISLDASEPDAFLRIIGLQTAYLDLCDRRGWNFVDKAPKAAVRHILAVVEPPELKIRLHDALKLEKSELEDDFFGFCEFLQEEAEICERFHPLCKFRTSPKPVSPKKTTKTSGSSGASSSNNPRPRRILPPCLNPKCSKNHFVIDCPDTPPEEAKRLLDAKRAEPRKIKPESKFSSASETLDDKGSNSEAQASSSVEKSSAVPALVMAELSGFKFACRIDSGADEVAVSDTIIQFLGDEGTFLPTLQLSKAKTFKAVDRHTFKSPGMVQLCPTIKTVAGPCRLRNIKAYIMPCKDTTLLPGADCAGEIVLGNLFLVHSGLDVTDFLANNIDHLSSLDYGALNTIKHPVKVGKLGARLLTDQPSSSEIDIATISPRICNIVSNGDFLLKDGDEIDYKDLKSVNKMRKN
ncbi:unnamed protein product [Agarophyton chilense]